MKRGVVVPWLKPLVLLLACLSIVGGYYWLGLILGLVSTIDWRVKYLQLIAYGRRWGRFTQDDYNEIARRTKHWGYDIDSL